MSDNTFISQGMDATEGLVRGQGVIDTEQPIRIPVGNETLGRIMNVIGEPVDEPVSPRSGWLSVDDRLVDETLLEAP